MAFAANIAGTVGLGVAQSLAESKALRSKEEREREKASLVMYTELVQQGYTPVGPSGAKSGSAIRVGNLPLLEAPAVDKRALFELEMARTKTQGRIADVNLEIAKLTKENLISRDEAEMLTALATKDAREATRQIETIKLEKEKVLLKKAQATGGVKVGTIQQYPTTGPNGEAVTLVREMTQDGWVVRGMPDRFKPTTQIEKDRLAVSKEHLDISKDSAKRAEIKDLTDLEAIILKPENMRIEDRTKAFVSEFHQRSEGTYGYKWSAPWLGANKWTQVPLPRLKTGERLTPKWLSSKMQKYGFVDIWAVVDKLRELGQLQELTDKDT